MAGPVAKAADPTDIRNWQRRSDVLTTSGRLSSQDPARLAAVGVRHVINLALDDHPEALAEEARLMAEAGIAYTHIPVPFDAPTSDHVSAMQDAMAAAEGPVHIHCIMNYRVSAFLYLTDCQSGIPSDQAHATMAQIWDPFASDQPLAKVWAEFLKDQT